MLQKLNNILTGWKNVAFETPEIKMLAQSRAMECSKCECAVWGMVAALVDDDIKDIRGLKCDKCDCPLSAKLRSPDENCPLNKWQAHKKK